MGISIFFNVHYIIYILNMYMFFYPHFCVLNAMYFWTSSPFKTREVGWKLVDQNQKSPD